MTYSRIERSKFILRDRNSGEKRGDIEHANDDDSDEEKYPIVLRANYNTMKSEIRRQ